MTWNDGIKETVHHLRVEMKKLRRNKLMYLLLFISMKIGYGYPVPSDKVSFAKFLTPLPGKGSVFSP